MEPLPRGANFQRALMLWEIGLHIAGDPNTPYYGPRDMCISVGSGSNENFQTVAAHVDRLADLGPRHLSRTSSKWR